MGNAVLKIWEGVYTSNYTNKIRDIMSSNKSVKKWKGATTSKEVIYPR